MESPVRILSSGGVDRQCHICGMLYTKASLPTHQRSCIKKRFKSRSVMSAGMAREYSTFPCVSCMHRIPQHKMMEHLRICKGLDHDQSFSSESLEFNSPSIKIKKFPRSVKTAGHTRNPAYTPPAADIYEPHFKETITEPIQESESVIKIPDLPCSICNRKFILQDRLDKHYAICSKSKKPRRVFDTVKARVIGTDMEKYALNPSKPDKKIVAAMNKKSNWRDRHESFINAIRAARQPNSAPPPPEANLDYVSCPHCKRRFNPDTAARHIPVCNQDPNKISNKHNHTKNSGKNKSSESLKKRTAYKPPLPSKK